jgi:hypothetical protein
MEVDWRTNPYESVATEVERGADLYWAIHKSIISKANRNFRVSEMSAASNNGHQVSQKFS